MKNTDSLRNELALQRLKDLGLATGTVNSEEYKDAVAAEMRLHDLRKRYPYCAIQIVGQSVAVRKQTADETHRLIEKLRQSARPTPSLPAWIRNTAIVLVSACIGFIGGMFAGGVL